MRFKWMLFCIGILWKSSKATECPACTHSALRSENVPQDAILELVQQYQRNDFKCAENMITQKGECGINEICSTHYYHATASNNRGFPGAKVEVEMVVRGCGSPTDTECQPWEQSPDMKIPGFSNASFSGYACTTAIPKMVDLKINEDGIIAPAITDSLTTDRGVDAPGGSSESIPKTTAIPLDPMCYSPDGTQCSWYRNCLEKRFSCKELGQSYALDYGEKFCNLYTDHYASFDDVGQKWVNAVRKCLQLALVPRIRSLNTVPCEQIKDEAFASHTGCYVTPPDGARSFCDIGYKNVFRVMGTIKSALIQFGTIWRTISQGFSTVVACMNRDDKDSLANKGNMMQVKAQIREGQNVSNTAHMRVDIESAVSAHMGEGVFVYAFPELPDSRTRRSPENVIVIVTNVLVLPRAEYDLNYHSNDTVNVTNVVDGFLDGLADGSVQLSLPWPLQDIRQCDGVECEHSTRIVVPKITAKANDTNTADVHTSIFVIIGAIVGGCAVVIIAITILVWWKCRK